MSSVWRKFAQRRRTARRSTAVANDLPLFASIFIHLRVLDGVERLLGHEQAPSKMSHPATSEWKSAGFRHCASLLRRWIVHSPLFVFFLQISAVFGQRLKSQSSHPTNGIEIPHSSETNESSRHHFGAGRTCCGQERMRNRRPFSASPSNLVDLVDAHCPLDRRAVQKPWNCQDNKLAGRQTRRVDVFNRNLLHVRNGPYASLADMFLNRVRHFDCVINRGC